MSVGVRNIQPGTFGSTRHAYLTIVQVSTAKQALYVNIGLDCIERVYELKVGTCIDNLISKRSDGNTAQKKGAILY